MKDWLYNSLPHFVQNILISLYNYKAYKIRYGGNYKKYRAEKKKNRNLSLTELQAYQKRRYAAFINFAQRHSAYYKNSLAAIEAADNIDNIRNLPIIDKETLRSNIDSIIIQTDEKLQASKTGGTTGKSLTVKYRPKNTQERFAFLDDFRSRFGYELGKKTAWFSGKSLLNNKDIAQRRFWKTDHLYNVRYYSTFHIKEEYLKHYVENLITYQPAYFVGFPSTILEIAKYGISNQYTYPSGVTKAIFPTAESVTAEMREIIESFFHTKMYDQYASSEGAPFIFECKDGNLHLELQSGVFEVLDKNNEPSNKGRLVVTSFTTEGTPLIRYDIGDSIVLDEMDNSCDCGNHNPMVKEILGRIDDFIYSPENGKINLGNISNTLKDTKGIVKFQVIQNSLNRIDILVVHDDAIFTSKYKHIFLKNWRDRVGPQMNIQLSYVDEIPMEKSGKYRMVKNNVKHLI